MKFFQKKESKKMETLFGHPFGVFFTPSCESTMTEAERLLESTEFLSRFDEGAVWTSFQRAGKGRFAQRKWVAKRGQSLLVTLILNADLYGVEPQVFPLLAGLALSRYLRRLGVVSEIKWPNDIIVEDKKIAGILCQWQEPKEKKVVVSNPFLAEAKISRGKVLCGIGLNIRQRSFKEAFPRGATSLYLATGKGAKKRRFSLKEVLQGVLSEFAQLEKESSQSLKSIEEINSLLYKKNELVDFAIGDPQWNQKVRGKFLGVSKDGLLQFQVEGPLDTEIVKEFLSGEIL